MQLGMAPNRQKNSCQQSSKSSDLSCRLGQKWRQWEQQEKIQQQKHEQGQDSLKGWVTETARTSGGSEDQGKFRTGDERSDTNRKPICCVYSKSGTTCTSVCCSSIQTCKPSETGYFYITIHCKYQLFCAGWPSNHLLSLEFNYSVII